VGSAVRVTQSKELSATGFRSVRFSAGNAVQRHELGREKEGITGSMTAGASAVATMHRVAAGARDPARFLENLCRCGLVLQVLPRGHQRRSACTRWTIALEQSPEGTFLVGKPRYSMILNSTRRFLARPSADPLSAMGWFGPKPSDSSRLRAMPFCAR
jgi:hypothetical protein